MILKRLAVATTASINITEVEMVMLPLHPPGVALVDPPGVSPLHPSAVQQVDMKPVPPTTVLDSVQALVVVYERVTYDTLPPTIAVYFYNE